MTARPTPGDALGQASANGWPPVQRQQGATTADRCTFVDDTIRFFDAASGFYTTKAEVREAPGHGAVPSPDASMREIAGILPRWRTAYEGARQLITGHLGNDPQLTTRLQMSYQRALEALHRIARNGPRVNVILVAAPGRDDDQFIRNATAYARTYFTRPTSGDTVVVVEGVTSLDELLSAVESAQPERMVRRIDIFAHGTIEPSNQLKLAGRWHSAEQFENALAARGLTSEYLQSISRFDTQSTVEFHGCRLGGGQGERFLGAAGRALGGAHQEEVIGYRERWFPRRNQLNWRGHPVTNTGRDIYDADALPIRTGSGSEQQRAANQRRFIGDFEADAIRLFDSVVSGSLEVKPFLTPQEQAAGDLPRDRKIEVMRAMYDSNGAWLLGFLNPAHRVPDMDPAQALRRDDYTFTRERDAWNDRTLRVRVGP